MEERLFCQSCGMPLESQEFFGTNADHSLNHDFCTYCFKEGKFTQDLTMDQMIEHCADFVDDFNADSGLNLTREQVVEQMKLYFPNLKRWAKN